MLKRSIPDHFCLIYLVSDPRETTCKEKENLLTIENRGRAEQPGEGGLAALQKVSRDGRSRDSSVQRAETKEFRVRTRTSTNPGASRHQTIYKTLISVIGRAETEVILPLCTFEILIVILRIFIVVLRLSLETCSFLL